MAGKAWGWIGVSGLLAASATLSAQTTKARTSAASPAAAPVTLSSQLESWFVEANRRAPGTWGIAVADQQGRLVWGIQPTRPMIPASTIKLLTTGFARSVLGSDARNSTRVVGDGQLDPATGIWQGTWALELNGDPSLEHQGASVTSLTDLAVQLADRGIRRLLGQLKVVSASGVAEAIFPATWSARHQGRVFAPPVGNLTVHDNLVIATVTPGRVGQPVRLASTRPIGA
ncbi:MAG: D-alanyl-D-alanine carboxypeptidase, partial [Gemmatimonadales bacterium]